MKEALIFTYSRSYNYGANLQAFALRNFVRELGWKCKTIDIRSENQKNNKVELRKDFRGLFINFFTLLKMKELKEGKKKFNDFDYGKEDRLVIDCVNEEPDFKRLNERGKLADVYIVGSDQVFSPNLMSPLYFLDFNTEGVKKVSYAASIGVGNVPKEKEIYFKKHLEKFSFLSVREESAKNILDKIIDKNIEVNIDPVFLLNEEKWIEIESSYKKLKPNEYILVYLLYRPNNLNQYLKELHKKTGLPIVLIDTTAFRNIYNNLQILDAGPREFIWLIHNARMVVTSSFHGTAFSIIFKKDFVVFNNPATPERINQILEKFDLKNHCQTVNFDLIKKNFNLSEEKKKNILKIIKDEQERSHNYLINAMES